MSEYIFGFGRGWIANDVAARIDFIAHEHGAVFVTVHIPGEGFEYWFAAPNRSNTINQLRAKQVWRALQDADLR